MKNIQFMNHLGAASLLRRPNIIAKSRTDENRDYPHGNQNLYQAKA